MSEGNGKINNHMATQPESVCQNQIFFFCGWKNARDEISFTKIRCSVILEQKCKDFWPRFLFLKIGNFKFQSMKWQITFTLDFCDLNLKIVFREIIDLVFLDMHMSI